MSLQKLSGSKLSKLEKAKDMLVSGDNHRTKLGRLTQDGKARRSYLRNEIKNKKFGGLGSKLISQNSKRAAEATKDGNTGLSNAYKKEHIRLSDIAKKGK